MTDKRTVKNEIHRQFEELREATKGKGEGSSLLSQALGAAVEQEKNYRKVPLHRMAGVAFKQPLETAARFHVLRWFRDPRKASSVLDAAKMSRDCLYGSALREWFEREKVPIDLGQEFPIEYLRDIAGVS